MSRLEFHHAIKVNESICVGCTHCINACPTEAIRVKHGKADIDGSLCVDCGECMRACPVEAFYVEDDDLNLIEKYKYKVALFPAVMVGQFPPNISEDNIYKALEKIGFTDIYEVENAIQLFKETLQEYVEMSQDKPCISSYCPAIVRLIQIKFPDLVENIVLLKSPHDLAAHFLKKKLLREGAKEEEIGIFYVTPCAAKIASVKSPIGETQSVIDGVINMERVYNLVMKEAADNNELSPSFDFRKNLAGDGIRWSLVEGEAFHIDGRTFSIDGMNHVIRFLERLENDYLPSVDFLELRACDQSCAGGILLTGNPFLTADRLKRRAARYPNEQNFAFLNNADDKEELKKNLHSDEIPPCSTLSWDEDFMKALEKMNKARRIMCHLPGIDCGACGAPTCQALAKDMVMTKAKMSDCIFVQQAWEKQGRITPENAFKNLEKKWGKNRFDVDCFKKGAKYEGG